MFPGCKPLNPVIFKCHWFDPEVVRRTPNLGLVEIRQSSVLPGDDVYIVAQQVTQGQIDWHVLGGLRRIDHPCAEARWICSIERTLPACCVCPRHGDENSVSTSTAIDPKYDHTH